MKLLLLTLGLHLAFCRMAAHAAEPELPYTYYTLQQAVTAPSVSGASLPKTVSVVDYREATGYDDQALLTLRARKPVVVAMLLYTASYACIASSGVLLPEDHETTFSALLPDESCLLRVMVLDRYPDSKLLANLAARPVSTKSTYVLGEVWQRTLLRSTKHGTAVPPWEDAFEYFPRLSSSRSRWPLWLARIDSAYEIHAKDCSVDYSGLPAIELGQHGPIGAWPLEIADRWTVRFFLPPRLAHRTALLVLTSNPGGTEFEVRANGFSVPVIPDNPEVSIPRPGIEIGGFLQSGQNEIELRPPTFGQGGRLVRAELWIE
jgi:hypothetical protein